jgi:hypothetical protein
LTTILLENTMYDKNGNLIDRRELLKIKIKSLAAEARIIRREAQRVFGDYRYEMNAHRTGGMRRAARETLIAYGLIRGKTIAQMEPNAKRLYNVDAVQAMIRKYGPIDKAANAALVKLAAHAEHIEDLREAA